MTVIVIATVVNPSTAADSSSDCLIELVNNQGTWQAFALEASADLWSIKVAAQGARGTHMQRYDLYAANGTRVSIGGGGLAPLNDGVRVGASSALRVDATIPQRHPGYSHNYPYNNYGQGVFTRLASGSLVLLTFSAGDVEQSSLSVCGAGVLSATLLGSGDSVFAYDLSDFETGMLGVDASVHALGVGARVEKDLSKQIDVEGALFGGLFEWSLQDKARSESSGDVDVEDSWVEKPTGRQECPCSSRGVVGAGAWGTGVYDFRVSSVGYGFAGLHEVMLYGAIIDPVTLTRMFPDNEVNP